MFYFYKHNIHWNGHQIKLYNNTLSEVVIPFKSSFVPLFTFVCKMCELMFEWFFHFIQNSRTFFQTTNNVWLIHTLLAIWKWKLANENHFTNSIRLNAKIDFSLYNICSKFEWSFVCEEIFSVRFSNKENVSEWRDQSKVWTFGIVCRSIRIEYFIQWRLVKSEWLHCTAKNQCHSTGTKTNRQTSRAIYLKITSCYCVPFLCQWYIQK